MRDNPVRQDSVEIEITEKMIEAGLSAYAQAKLIDEPITPEAVRQIYIAMESSRADEP